MVEIGNRLLKIVICRSVVNENQWENIFAKAIQALVHRIIFYLGMSPANILLGRRLFFAMVDDCKASFVTKTSPDTMQVFQQPVTHVVAVRAYLYHRVQTHDYIFRLRFTKERQRSTAGKYNGGIRFVTFKVGDFIMLHQERKGKLDPNWRGFFSIIRDGIHGAFHFIKEISGRKIFGTFHGDDLKLFILRTGYFSSLSDFHLPIQKTIK